MSEKRVGLHIDEGHQRTCDDMVQTEALPCGECDLGWQAGFSMQDTLVAMDTEQTILGGSACLQQEK